MNRHRTLFVLLLGTGLGFSLAFASGSFMAQEPRRVRHSTPESRLFVEVLRRVQQDYVDDVDEPRLLRLAARGMVAGLDPHSALLDASGLAELRAAAAGEYIGVGVELAVVDAAITVVAPVQGSPAARAGMRGGDRLVAIDDRELRAADLAEAGSRLRGPRGTRVTLTVERDGVKEPLRFRVNRGPVSRHSVRDELLGSGIGYVRVSYFGDRTANELRQALLRLTAANDGSLRGLVLDLRGNPGGALDTAIAVADQFLDRGVIVTAAGRTPDASFSVRARAGDLLEGAPVVVLVDGGSASAAEIVAGALQDHHRALVLGRATFGKASVQTLLPLADGHALQLTTSRYFTPSGASIHARGIQPDVVLTRSVPAARLTESMPLVDRDEEVRAALATLTGRMRRYAGAVPTTY